MRPLSVVEALDVTEGGGCGFVSRLVAVSQGGTVSARRRDQTEKEAAILVETVTISNVSGSSIVPARLSRE